MSNTKIVAVQEYTGNHTAGKSRVVKGDTALAWAANAYCAENPVRDNPDDYTDTIQIISNSRAGGKNGERGFSRVTSYRVVRPDFILNWAKQFCPEIFERKE